jgi:hypothetical protein
VLPGGTPIKVALTDKISSATANVGDTFDVEAAEDIVVDDWIVVKKGAPGQGEVLAVDRAGSHGHPGSLGVQMDWIYSADGHKVRLTSQRKTEEGRGETGASSTATILSYVFLGPLGLFAHNFVKGHDVVVDGSHPLTAYIDDSVYVVATTRGDGEPDSNFAQTLDAPAPALAAVPLVQQTPAAKTQVAVAPPVQQSDAGAPTTAPLIDLEGNQPEKSAAFIAPAVWTIQYSFDCGSSPKDTPTGFAIMVAGAAQPVSPIVHSGESGTDVVTEHQPGTLTLNVQSHCVWHVKALGST